MTLRVLSYNIRYGGVGHLNGLADVIRGADADVVMLQEATDTGAVLSLAQLCDYPQWGCQPGHSTGFLSRHPVEHFAWHQPPGGRHPFLEVVLQGDAPRLFGLHLTAWFSNWTEQRRTRELQALLGTIREHQHGFHLIVGDFNALAPGAPLDVGRLPPWIQGMVWLSGRNLARTTIQAMLDERYADCWATLHPGQPGFTFPVWDPHVRLDYAFAPERDVARVRACDVLIDGARTGASDHYPLLIQVE